MIIYIDLLFFREILMNFFLIFCTNKIQNKRSKKIAMLASSVFGASYTLLCLIHPYKMLITARTLIMLAMIYIGTEHTNIADYLKSIFTYYLLSFLCSGIYYYFYNNKTKGVIILGIGTFIVIYLIKDCIDKYKISSYICGVNLNLNRNREYIRALIDTGHSLKSTNNSEVIVLSPRIIKKTCDNHAIDILINNMLVEENPYIKEVKIINYKSLGNKHGIKYGLLVKNVKIKYQNKIISTNAVIIASEEDFNEYDAILSLSIIKGGKYNGNSNNYERKGEEAIC